MTDERPAVDPRNAEQALANVRLQYDRVAEELGQPTWFWLVYGLLFMGSGAARFSGIPTLIALSELAILAGLVAIMVALLVRRRRVQPRLSLAGWKIAAGSIALFAATLAGMSAGGAWVAYAINAAWALGGAQFAGGLGIIGFGPVFRARILSTARRRTQELL